MNITRQWIDNFRAKQVRLRAVMKSLRSLQELTDIRWQIEFVPATKEVGLTCESSYDWEEIADILQLVHCEKALK